MAVLEKSRDSMVFSQLRTGGVTHPLLVQAMAEVPREKFVPALYSGNAYVDEDIALGNDRYLIEPLVFGRMAQLLDLQRTDKLLLVGAGTGYSLAVLSYFTDHIVAIESERELSNLARKNLQSTDAKPIEIYTSALSVGYQMHAPYQKILIEGGIETIPHSLTDQLDEGGRLVTVEMHSKKSGGTSGLGKIVSWDKLNGQLYPQYHADASVPLLSAFKRKTGFQF